MSTSTAPATAKEIRVIYLGLVIMIALDQSIVATRCRASYRTWAAWPICRGW
jgi:hypothetical protein